jgi:hypothetical protein
MGDQPLPVAVLIHEGVTCGHVFGLAGVDDAEGANARIGDLVAAEFDIALIDLAERLLLQKVFEIVLNLAAGEPRDVGNCGQQNRIIRITLADPSGIAASECLVPTVEKLLGEAQRRWCADGGLGHSGGIDRCCAD